MILCFSLTRAVATAGCTMSPEFGFAGRGLFYLGRERCPVRERAVSRSWSRAAKTVRRRSFDSGTLLALSVESFRVRHRPSGSNRTPTNMPLPGQLTEVDLNDVANDTRSRTFWRAMRLKAIARVAVRSLAALMGLASIGAASIVGTLSFAGYG